MLKKNLSFLFITFIIISASTSQVLSQDITDGLIAKYEFNGNADDIIGVNNGIVQGASLADDRFSNSNSAYSFDGIDDYIEIPDSNLLDFEYNEDFSISIWVNISTIQNDLNGHNNEIIGKWNALRSMPYPYTIRYWNENASDERKNRIFNLRYDTETCNNNPILTGNCYISKEKWHHLVFLKRGSTLEYYQDNQLLGTTIDNTNSTCNTTNNNRILIGRRTLGQRHFTGLIDDISFYNRAIDPGEIEIIFSQNDWNSPTINDITFLSFDVPNQISSTLDSINQVINILVTCDTDITQIIANFNLTQSTEVTVNGIFQESNQTPNNFSNPLIYSLINKQYCIEEEWTVLINVQSFSQEEIDESTKILSFNIEGQISKTEVSIIKNEIIVYMPCNYDLSELKYSFSLPSESIATINESNSTSYYDFRSEVIFTVRSKNTCSFTEWKINVLTEKLDFKSIDPSNVISFIPNIITPNFDSTNDQFEIGELFANSEVKIFNRHGILVYENLNYNNEFGGESLASGQYYYMINSVCFKDPIKGNLRILK